MDLQPFIDHWRDKADAFRPYCPEIAKLIDDFTAELEEYARQDELEALTLSQAAEESGFTEAHLGRRVADGTIPNAGKKGAPRIRRGDLPRKPKKTLRRTLSTGEPDLAEEVLRERGLASLED